ncbi:MAG: penicillin-binding protein activator [Oligoflexia bacterium]|nr:penicillin-binding protein activator [Oligoflexia bacterium]
MNFKRLNIIISAFAVIVFAYSCAQKKADIILHEKISVVEGLGNLDFQRLEQIYASRDYNTYIARSSVFLKKYYNSSFAADVLHKRGLIDLSRRNYSAASLEFNKLLGMFPGSRLAEATKYYYAISEFKKGNVSDASVLLDRIDFNSENLAADVKEKAMWLKANVLLKTQRTAEALKTFVELYNITGDESIKSKTAISILSYIDKISLEEVEDLKSRFSSTHWESYFLFEAGERYIRLGNVNKSKDAFRELISDYPDHEYRVQAENYLKKLDSMDKVDPLTVGVVLPLSGRYAPFGQKSLQGIQLAAGFFSDTGKEITVPIKLAIMDTNSDADVTKLAMDRLIAEDHVIAAIGSLRSNTANIVAEQCVLAGIPNISLSQREGVTETGGYVFSVAMTNSLQIKRLVSYAMEQMGIKKFGILYPRDGYGTEFMKYFWDEVLRQGGEVVAIESYEHGQKDFRDEVKKLVGIYHVTPRRAEYTELKELKIAELGREIRSNEIELPSIVSFEALFVPDDARVVAQIAPYLAFYDVENVVLLGPNTWHSPQLIKRGGEHVNGAVFVDGFYSNPSFKEGKDFITRFKSVFGMEPGVLEAQAYDAAMIILKIMDRLYKSGGIENLSREKLKSEIAALSDYKGATGLISFNDKGEASKQLFVLGVDNWRIVLKDQ